MKYFDILAAVVSQDDLVNLPKNTLDAGPDGTISKILKIAFGVAGAISLLIVTIGAFQYVVSQGDSQSISKAKNTIIYAILGLVVCIMAFGIVTFVTSRI